MICYPAPLAAGSVIAISALSAGVPAAYHARLDRVLAGLTAAGYQLIEGRYLRQNQQHVSASAEERAAELMQFLLDDDIAAILPPWGGELAMQLLPLLDFAAIANAKPKWLLGFSDISTISSVLTAQCGWATVHGANLMQLHPLQTEPLTANTLKVLQLKRGDSLLQHASSYYETQPCSFADNPDALFNLTEPTLWQWLGQPPTSGSMQGRLLGGCLDTLMHLLLTDYLDIRQLKLAYGAEGVLLYLENAELSATALARALLALKYRGVLQHIKGIVFGRDGSQGQPAKDFSYSQALSMVLQDTGLPVLINADIGHLAPNLALINGAVAEIGISNGKGWIRQQLV
ncbi:S66 family peptidase [Arsukibacterium sp.]|uniref:S66 family peptidase n=1 Tax=Arsukibacterium sp. TaxID=1977258 RepID=UPI002FDB6675